MTSEQIARAHQFREGFELVDYGEVGLPVFRLTLEAVTLAHRRMPTVQEFAMRCVAIGISDSRDIATTLGLKADIVRASVGALLDAGYATIMGETEDGIEVRLTETGEARLSLEIEEVPQDETLVIDYDAILRRPVRLAAETVLRAADLRGFGAVEIRPYPADAPSISELGIPDVVKVVRRASGDEFRRTVLALKRIERRTNLFREGVALVYSSKKGDDVQIAFVVGGRLSEPLERTYAQNGGPKKMGFVKAIASGPGTKALQRLVGKDALRDLPADDVIVEARRREADAMAAVAAIEPAVQALPERARRGAPSTVALDSARQEVAMASHVLATFPIRQLACYEQDMLLDEALRNSKRSLFVTSAGLQGASLNGFRLREIDRLVEKQVDVEIRSYLAPSLNPRSAQRYDPLVELTKRSERSALRLAAMNNAEFYFLISDGELAVVSNRPFFGEMARRTGFMRVAGLVVRDRSLIAHLQEIAVGESVRRPRRA